MKKSILMLFSILTITVASGQKNLADYVSTLQGSDSWYEMSYGNTYPMVLLPFAMHVLGVQTGENNDPWKYQYSKDEIRGFQLCHQRMPWGMDYNVIALMPISGKLTVVDTERAVKFSHKNELARPYFYSIQLDNGIHAEMAPSQYGGMMRFTFPQKEDAYIVLDGFLDLSSVEIDPSGRRITGWVFNTGNNKTLSSDYKNYFVIEFNQPLIGYGTWDNVNMTLSANKLREEGKGKGAYLQFKPGTTVEVRIGASYIDPAQASINLHRYLDPYKSLDDLKIAALNVWNETLERVKIEGGSEEDLKTFYSCYYRTNIFPREFTEYNAAGKPYYRDPNTCKVREGYHFSDNTFWDTFRDQNPWMVLMYPTKQGRYMVNMLNTYQDFGWLPSSSGPNERGSMVGNHGISLLLDAYAKGLHTFDTELALEAYLHEATHKGPGGPANGRDGHEDYYSLNYLSFPAYREAVSKTMDYSYDDWCGYRLAKLTGNKQLEERFAKTMFNYKNLYNKEIGFFVPRDKDGSWSEFKGPFAWAGPYTEGCAWHFLWYIFHDIDGLKELLGGDKRMINRMDSLFTLTSDFDIGWHAHAIHEMTEITRLGVGQWALNNQTMLHFPYMYNWTSEPWKCQKWVREGMKNFNSTERGYPGDEDQGSTAIWYVMSALGFYTVCPGTDEYIIGTPCFPKATITFEDGKKLVIKALNDPAKNIYVQSVTLNGKEVKRNYFTHKELTDGGEIVFVMGPEPNKSRGTTSDCWPYSVTSMTDRIFSQTMPVLWEIGKKDKSAEEFALGPYDNGRYSEKFGNDAVVYEIGKSKPETDFPFVLPGPDDRWAGSTSKQIMIHFGIHEMPLPCAARLELHFVETIPTSPLLEITVNDYKMTVQAPVGIEQYFRERKVNPADLSTILNIPENVLKKGNNTIVITTKTGNYVVFDHVLFSTAYPLELAQPAAEIKIIATKAKQALVYGKNRALYQPLILQVANWGKMQTVDLLIDGKKSGTKQLYTGLNTFETGIPEVHQETDVTVALSVNSKIIAQSTVKVFPVKKWTIYMVQHTHTDIGYTKPQTEILAEHIRYIDYAIEYCELTEHYPDDAKFRWTCEASWAVKEYLQNRPKEQIDKLVKWVKAGRIEVAGMFFNMADLVDENSLKTFLEPIREFKKWGIPITTAMQNDVHGIPWCLADYMPDMGVKYFTMGENADHSNLLFDRPTVYKWESPSGKQAYAFRSDHYHKGGHLGIDKGYEAMEPAVFSYLESLENLDYPFDAISIQYSGYSTDNSPPSMHHCDLFSKWNSTYAFPKLRSAVFHEFMDYVTEKYDQQLPVHRGAYPDWWSDGFASAARETAASRRTHADMITIQGLLSMAVLKEKTLPPHVPDKIRHVHENLLFYDEHTYGAAESVTDPACENSQLQWALKSSYAWEALKNAQIMYETSIGLLQNDIQRGEHPTVTFYNTLNWTRSGMVELYVDFEIIPRNRAFRMVDEAGKELTTQPLRTIREGAYFMVYAENIPPMGYKTYHIMVEKDDYPESTRALLNDHMVENEFYKITFDAQTGSIKSLFDKKLQLEMVDADSPWLLGAFVYETLGNRTQLIRAKLTEYDRKGLTDVHIRAGANGSIYQTIHIEGKSACCNDDFGVKTEIRLFHNEKRIELHFAVKKTPVIDPEGIYVAFPFKLDQAKLYFDVQGGTVGSGVDQLEGSASDWNTVQNFVAARNDKAQFVVGSNLIPMFQMGGICTGQFQRKKTYEFPHVYSWVTSNYWHTNFRATQEGELRWSYYLTSDNDVSNTFATRFGWSSRVPLYARVMPEGKANYLPASYSSFRFGNDNLLMTSATPSIDKDYILINVRELDGKSTSFQLSGSSGQSWEFSIVNALEEPMQKGLKATNFAPFENKFIKFKIQ